MDTQMLKRRYELETALLRLQRQQRDTREKLSQAKFDLREKQDALLQYEGSIKGFFHRLSGKQEEQKENLTRKVRQAETALNALQREREALEHRRAEAEKTLTSLPALEELRKGAEKEWAALEVRFCAEALLPLLEENEAALLEYRSLMRGEYPVISIQRQQEIAAQPNVWAEQCRAYLLRLKEALDILGTPFELGSYYISPAAYLANVAAMHNRRDRLNQALDQVEAVKKQVRKMMEE